MKKKSMGMNAVLNGIKSMMSILFPLITFPYVSKVLQVENLGKYNFASSIVNYFILLAALGISTYAIREGAKYRDDKNKMSLFASEMFSINMLSTIIAYILLVISVVLIPKLHTYGLLIMIFSVEILFRTIGVEWLYSIYEDYAYITKRSIIVQFISMILLFLLVKEKNDYYIYAGITVFANAGANIFSYIYAKKKCTIRLTHKIDWKKHLKPILLIFATTIATNIYVNSDITILGVMASDYEVGLYSVSSKVYRIIKMLLSSVLIVSIPRLSNYIGCGEKEKYYKTFQNIFDTMLLLVTPVVVGLFMVSEYVIIFISDITYVEATFSLKILSVAAFVCMFGWLYNSCVLIPNKKEDKVLVATIVSALLNIGLNILLVPFYKHNAAAFTTVIAEFSSMIICMYYSKDIVKVKECKRDLFSIIVGCLGIIVICTITSKLNLNVIMYLFITIIISALAYVLILILFKNSIVINWLGIIKRKIMNK